MSSCKLTSFLPLGVYGMDMNPTTICISVETNGASVTIIIYLGIATKYNGVDLTNSILKLEVLA